MKETKPTTPRLRELEDELEMLNEGISSNQEKGERVPEHILKTALLLGVKIEYYRMALEDLWPVVKAAKVMADRYEEATVSCSTSITRFRDALAGVE